MNVHLSPDLQHLLLSLVGLVGLAVATIITFKRGK